MFDCLNNDIATDGNIYYDHNGISYVLKDGEATVIKQSKEIENAIIPDKVVYKEKTFLTTKIIKNAFFGCNLLSKVEIPDTVKSIGQSAFNRCKQLDRIFYKGTAEKWESVDKNGQRWKRQFLPGCVFYCKDDYSKGLEIEEGVIKGIGKCKDNVIIVPSEATEIDDFAFNNNKKIVDVIFHKNVKSVGTSAFGGCVKLKKVIISNADCTIGKSAFYNCKNLREVELPKAIKSLKEGVFEKCMSLTKIEIPSSVVEIEEYAFSQCEKLHIVKVESKSEWKVYKKNENVDSVCIKSEEITAKLLSDIYKENYWIKA